MEKFILKVYQKTQKFLHAHKNKIIITKADKGSKTVIMYKEDYNSKINELLEDRNTYKTIRTDPTQKLQKINNEIVNDLFKSNHIDQWQKNKLYSSAAIAPRLYGLPKIHKTNLPLRPISSSSNVPCYQMSKYIGDILKNIISDKYNVKNCYEFKQKLQDIILEEDDKLVSFDVISLFTNIPTYLAIKIIMKNWTTIEKFTNIPKKQFLRMLEFCLKENNYFQYENKLFNQIFGMPMGNPLSPTIADIILDDLLDNAKQKLKEKNTNIRHISKYVDDIFAIIKERDKETILNTLNNYHTKIQFTIEMEQNNSLPYLDVKMHRNNNRIIFNWYSKSTSSGRMINYLSTQPNSQKINTATNFINKILDISDVQFKDDNINKIKTILQMNNYPNFIINNLIQKKVNQTTNPINKTTTTNNNNSIIRYFSMRYIPKLTDGRSLHSIIKQESASYAYKSNATLRNIFTNTKAPIEKNQQHNVVYEVCCGGTEGEKCNLTYIGTTKRQLGIRMTEHKADIKKKKPSTGLSQHIIDSGHIPNFDDVRVLDKEKRMTTRYTLESLRIQQKIRRTMNTQEDRDNTIVSYALAIK